MFVPRPSNFPPLPSTLNTDSSLFLIHNHLGQELYQQYNDANTTYNNSDSYHQRPDRASKRVEARASKLVRPTRPQHSRRSSKKFLTSTSSEIYGDWNIKAKNEPRYQTKTKSKTAVKGGVRQAASIVSAPVALGNSSYMGEPEATSPSQPSPLRGQGVVSNIIPSSAPLPTPQQSPISEGMHKPFSPLKEHRRTPSASHLDSNNATTSWTVGQQNYQSRINPAQHNTASAMGRPTLISRGSEGGVSEGSTVDTQDPLTAKSKFMRVLNKFKGKHLNKSSSRSSTSGPSTTAYNSQPPDTMSDASSIILPSMHFGQVESIVSTDQGSTAHAARSDASSVSMRSYIEPPTERQKEPTSDIEMTDSERRRAIRIDQIRSGHSSLRAKFKNQVSNTLASIKSSSNIREKARSQASSSTTSPTSPISPHSIPAQDHQGSNASAESEPIQSNTPKNRHSRGFWTFPRIRPDSQVAQSLRAANGDPNGSERPSLQQDQDYDTIMMSPELPPITYEDDGADSDHSIDIIMPDDYDDYTQFAELPLRKRKKLEAAAAAAAQKQAGKPIRSMKRFLLHPKNAAEGDKGKMTTTNTDNVTSTLSNDHPGTSIVLQKNTKKRPKDQDSIEQKMGQEPFKLVKPNSGEPSEWRKAILRSLHLGRRSQIRRGASRGASSQTESAVVRRVGASHPYHRDSGVYPEDQGSQTGHHESIQSVRSKSLATSTHPSLLATTLSAAHTLGSRRETVEMVMRRRRRSSTARSSILDPRGSFHLPGGLNIIDDDSASTFNVTHTFTSFTLELAELHHAHAIVNNSVTPGLFNIKRQPKALLPPVDIEQEFRSFDSDGDAASGYTGDADISMEEIFVRPKTPVARNTAENKDKGKAREVYSPDALVRRRVSSVEGETDTVPELPTLSIRTRDLNRSSGGGGRPSGRESPRSPRKLGAASPTLHRKPSRQFLNGSYLSSASTSSPSQASNDALPIEDPISLKSKSTPQSTKPSVPALNTKPPLLVTKGLARQDSLHHQRDSSSYSHNSSQHHQQASSDTLVPHHPKNISTASTMTANSSYSTQTLAGGNGQLLSTFQPVEFDPSQEFPPTTPVDLKAMDFDTLLKTAEREQQKGLDDLRIKKRKSHQLKNPASLKERQNESNVQARTESNTGIRPITPGPYTKPLNPKSSLTAALVKSAPSLDELRTRGSGENADVQNGTSNGPIKNSKSAILSSRADPLRIPISKNTITFDVDENAVAAAASRSSPRPKRVMKKKMSVIKLSGNVQGRREDDGMIRVTVTSSAGEFRQGRAY
ncbi:hypothetical protein FBU30_011085 [Linnemannia zychae]|nr:hypothetical protein FBU30_011085 [Linnemannia zychae]